MTKAVELLIDFLTLKLASVVFTFLEETRERNPR
jgi:hypothetical protein